MPPAVPIPSNSSTSRLEHMLASFDEASRQRFGGRRDSGHGPTLPGITTASTTPPVHPFAQSVSSSFRPRVIRGPTTPTDGQPSSVGTRPSISPTRLRAGSHLSNRPQASVSALPNAVRAGLPTFTPPAYLANALMANLFHGGPPPPQAIVPNSRVAPDPQQIISDSEDSSHGHSGLSSRRRYRMQIPRNFTSWPTALPIPTQWSETDKHNHLIVSSNGKEVNFSGHSGTSETGSAAAIRAECSIPAACGVYYYEVKILDRGYRGQISVGFATKELHVSKLPGWEAGSWGYHGDDGLAFGGQPRPGSEFGPHFSTDDVIGCGINFLDHNAFFTKNGTLIGSVFSDIPDRDVYPAIGLRSSNEHIRANFGDSPFLFDIDAHVSRIKLKAWKDVQSHTTILSRSQPQASHYDISSVDVSKREHSDDGLARAARDQQEGLRGAMADLVMDYLVFQGYAKTAREFRSQLLDRVSKKPETPAKTDPAMDVDELPLSIAVRLRLDSMEHRTRAVNAVRNGDIDLALSIMQSHFPASLTHDEGLLRFKLQCQQFVELSLEAQEVKRRSDKEHEPPEVDAAKSGSVPTDGAFAMDLDDDEHVVPSSPASRGYVVWANGNSGSSVAKGKGRPNARRRSSASRTGGRSQSRNRGESGSLLSPISPSAMEEDKIQVIRYVERVVEYGMQFRKEWESDTRPFVKEQLRRTFGLVAYDNPRTDQRSKDLVSEEARLQLADEANRVILLSTVNEPMPLIERMYRHSNTTMQALGAIEVGAGAFMDVSRILEDFV